ncbi:MAG: ABC transporter ATP-binding protein [Vulcanimicrobiaceae bacterium]
MTLLQVRDVVVSFGALRAVDCVSLDLDEAQIIGVIGPNGAGKSSLFNAISGATRITSGEIFCNGLRIDRLRIDEIARSGIARTFQNIRLFGHMSVQGNILVGEHATLHSGVFADMLHTRAMQSEERHASDRAKELLEFVGISASHAQREASELAYGEQRRLEIARALAAKPKCLLLDEPAAGLNATEKRELAHLVRRIAEQKIAVLLVEHDMSFVMPLCERLVVLDYGKKIADAIPSVVRTDPAVLSAYLGVAP